MKVKLINQMKQSVALQNRRQIGVEIGVMEKSQSEIGVKIDVKIDVKIGGKSMKNRKSQTP